MARPSLYTDELGDGVAALIAEDNTYEQIAAIDGMPSKTTLISWLKTNEGFRTKCACAREIQAESIDNRIGNVIDKTENGLLTPDIARVVLSGLQWRASKKNPKVYGDKVDLTTAGKSINDPKAVRSKLSQLLGKRGIAFTAGGDGEDGERV